ncbi:hypothetical protein, partial [Pseudomonas sp.]|uniref:hypothetical protein n=1 Tax=Pseudomonas sp. TaxID=306 RepID=UPI003BB6B9F5
VEIWFAQKTKLSWFLRSNAEIERFSSCRKEALSETDFFNTIGRFLPVAAGVLVASYVVIAPCDTIVVSQILAPYLE